MTKIPVILRGCWVALALSLGMVAGPSWAQSVATNTALTPVNEITALTAKLAEARRRLQQVEAPGGMASGAPPEVVERDLRLRQVRLAMLARTYVEHITDIGQLETVRKKRAALEKDLASWSGLAERPPYSILLADQFRVERKAAEQNLAGLQERSKLLQQTGDDVGDRLQAARSAQRLASEKSETTRSESDEAMRAWLLEQTDIQAELMDAMAAHQALLITLVDENMQVERLKADLAKRKIDYIAGKTRFTDRDLESVHVRHRRERDALTVDLRAFAAAAEKEQTALEVAQKALADFQSKVAAVSGLDESTQTRLDVLERERERRQLQLDTLNAQMDYLRAMMTFTRGREVLWDVRYEGHVKADSASHQQAREALGRVLPLFQSQRKYYEQLRHNASNRVIENEQRIEEVGSASLTPHLRAMQSLYNDQVEMLQRVLAVIDSGIVLAEQMAQEFGSSGEFTGWRDRVDTARNLVLGLALGVWDFELVAVEDTVEVEGKQVVGKRSVTVGKVIRAIVIFILGYLLLHFISRMGEAVLIRWFGWKPASASIARTWLMTVQALLLILFVLIWVKIPFTLFAFMGGAAAIGLGFGLQNLFKNLISGLMILGERPFRVADLVEIGGIRGRVTDIGLRASTVIDGNGIETVIPNSNFVENNLTNWTLTSGKVRFNIKVGVAYGTSVRKVTQLLRDVADRHDMVLKNPEPEVLFEDFAGDALMFSLYYWLDVGSGVASLTVASDLRTMVDTAFSAEGVMIPSAQMDVQLSARNPVPVQVVADVVKLTE